MQNLLLVREKSTPQGTPGVITGMDFSFESLEKPWLDNEPEKSCIPEGTYELRYEYSEHFAKIYPELEPKGMCYHVHGVPNRSGILIHNANRQEQLLGCIALGLTAGVMPDSTGKPVKAVMQSKAAIKSFHEHLAGQPATLEIVGPYEKAD